MFEMTSPRKGTETPVCPVQGSLQLLFEMTSPRKGTETLFYFLLLLVTRMVV